MRKTLLPALLAVLLAGLGLAGSTPASAAGECDDLSEFTYEVDLGLACELTDGLLKVLVGLVPDPSEYVLTHVGDDPHVRDCCHEPLPAASNPVRCVGPSAYRFRAIYARPSNVALDESKVGEIRTALKRANAFLSTEAGTLGFSSDFRFYCRNDQIAVAKVELSRSTAEDSFSSIVTDLRRQGFDSSTAKYVVYYDGGFSGWCGKGTLNWDTSDVESNINNRGPDYAVNARCLDSDLGSGYNGHGAAVFMHEMFHTLGAVQKPAPNSTGKWAHCTDEHDLMCYDDGAPGGVQIVCGAVQLDCNTNTYWAPNKTANGTSWISNHWNIGACYLRFIARGCNNNNDNPPPPPTNLTVFSTAGSSQNELDWIGSVGATQYRVYRWTEVAVTGTQIAEETRIATVSTTEYTDSAPVTTTGQRVCYSVTAVNASGESGASNEACLINF